MSTETLARPSRPVLRWHGGKFRIRDWTIKHFPKHGVYVEVFGGAGSVLLGKRPVRIEVYNDTNLQVVELFRILRDPGTSAELMRLLELTPFSREEHSRAWEETEDPVESARRFIVRSFQSFGAKADKERNGWRTRTSKSVWIPCVAWNNYAAAIPSFTQRLRNTIIENQDWRRMLEIYDDSDTLFYLDPPYPYSTRTSGHRKVYGVHELSDEDHVELCRRACGLKGMVLIASYQNPIYDELLEGWQLVQCDARAQCNIPRVEALYINPAAQASNVNLFSEASR